MRLVIAFLFLLFMLLNIRLKNIFVPKYRLTCFVCIAKASFSPSSQINFRELSILMLGSGVERFF